MSNSVRRVKRNVAVNQGLPREFYSPSFQAKYQRYVEKKAREVEKMNETIDETRESMGIKEVADESAEG